jgi:hypothetical protein
LPSVGKSLCLGKSADAASFRHLLIAQDSRELYRHPAELSDAGRLKLDGSSENTLKGFAQNKRSSK